MEFQYCTNCIAGFPALCQHARLPSPVLTGKYSEDGAVCQSFREKTPLDKCIWGDESHADRSHGLSDDGTPLLADEFHVSDAYLGSYDLPPSSSQAPLMQYGCSDTTMAPALDPLLESPDSSGDLGGNGIIPDVSLGLEPRNSRTHAKFTTDEDRRIINLRNSGKSWKEIAEQLPGRSPGALQVHYSTKLKLKSVVWRRDLVRNRRFMLDIKKMKLNQLSIGSEN